MGKARRRENRRRKHARSNFSVVEILPPEILWKIIDIISRGWSGHPNCHPITCIRYISQVCRLWRELVLHSASVWANMIEIYFLSNASEEWRNEIMRRTGNAGLSISGSLWHATLDGQPTPKEQFLASLLETDWHRVVKIRLFIWNSRRNMHLNILQTFWTKPAPSLRDFGIKVLDRLTTVSLPPGAALFNNNAPHLRSFWWPSLLFDPCATSWTRQLSQLYLPRTCSVSQALDVLHGCPNLHKLVYDSQISFHTELALKKVHLPNLKHLTITAELSTCYGLLIHIIPKPACVLRMDMRSPYDVTTQELKTLMPILSRYLQAALDYPGRLYKLKFMIFGRYSDISLEGTKRTVVTSLTGDAMPAKIRDLYLDAISSCNLDSVISLHDDNYGLDLDGNLRIAALLRKLPNLQVLNASDTFLETIAADDSISFPHSLKRIKIDGFRSRTFDENLRLTLSVLEKIRGGIELDLGWRAMGDWRVLDEVPGLRVTWQDPNSLGYKQYTCGTGRAERLWIKKDETT